MMEKTPQNKGSANPSRREFLNLLKRAAGVGVGMYIGKKIAGPLLGTTPEEKLRKIAEELKNIRTVPEHPETVKTEPKTVDEFLESLGEKERVELKLCLNQYISVYTDNNRKALTPEDFTRLEEKFYQLFAFYVPNLSFHNKDVEKGFDGQVVGDSITYNSKRLEEDFYNEQVAKDLFEDKDIFGIERHRYGNFFVITAELSHKVHDAHNLHAEDWTSEADSLAKEKVRGFDEKSGGAYLGTHSVDEWVLRDFFNMRDPVYYKYNDTEFYEFTTHNVTETAVLAYLLEKFGKEKSFNEVHNFYINTYNIFMRTMDRDFVDIAKTDQALFLKALMNPSVLKKVMEKNLDIKTVIGNIRWLKDLYTDDTKDTKIAWEYEYRLNNDFNNFYIRREDENSLNN